MARITTKRQENEQGLCRICQAPRGCTIKVNGKCVGRVRYARSIYLEDPGFYFVITGHPEIPIRFRDSAEENLFWGADLEKAKATAIEYVRAELAKVEGQ